MHYLPAIWGRPLQSAKPSEAKPAGPSHPIPDHTRPYHSRPAHSSPDQPSYLRHVSGISIHSTHIYLLSSLADVDLARISHSCRWCVHLSSTWVAPVANTFFTSSSLYWYLYGASLVPCALSIPIILVPPTVASTVIWPEVAQTEAHSLAFVAIITT